MEQIINVLEQYDMEVRSIRKGRGCWIVNSDNDVYMLKEYRGSEEKACMQKILTNQIVKQTGIKIQEICESKEGQLTVLDKEEKRYTLESFMNGRECSLKDEKDCQQAVRTMARMHKGMSLRQEECLEFVVKYSLYREFKKRNTELRRIRRYLKEKKQKSEFERFLLEHFDEFFESALQVESDWAYYEPYSQMEQHTVMFCHGDYQHHNIWMDDKNVMVLQFDRFMADYPVRDLCLFLRKLLEKNAWDMELGKKYISLYEKERTLPCIEKISMVYRFLYPEKFWKIANFYYNSKKSFIPEKNMDKLVILLEQEKSKERFIRESLQIVL